MLPLMKFGVLAMRQLSKPIANAIKRRCLSNPRFRAGCISFAQYAFSHMLSLARRQCARALFLLLSHSLSSPPPSYACVLALLCSGSRHTNVL
jgi:hypothetical protein